MVSLQGYEYRPEPWNFDTEKIVAAYIDRHRAELADPRRFVGAWIHDGSLYLDVSEAYSELASALAAGERNRQIAIWDVVAGREIAVEPAQKAA